MFAAIKARRRAAQEQAIISAWWVNRIDLDRDNSGKLNPASKYFDELLSDTERREKDEAEFFAKFDRQMGTMQ